MSVAVVASRRRSSRRRTLTRSLKTIPEEQPMAFTRKPLAYAEDLDRKTLKLIEQARSLRKLPGLRRNCFMDNLAREHAKSMAQMRVVSHSVSTVFELQEALGSQTVGENIHRGKNVSDLHAEIMLKPKSINRINMMSSKFDEIGTGCVLGEDGLLYSVQLYRSSTL